MRTRKSRGSKCGNHLLSWVESFSPQQHKAHTCFANKKTLVSFHSLLLLLSHRTVICINCRSIVCAGQMCDTFCCCTDASNDFALRKLADISTLSLFLWLLSKVIHFSKCFLSYNSWWLSLHETYLHSVHLSEHSQLSDAVPVIHSPQHFSLFSLVSWPIAISSAGDL